MQGEIVNIVDELPAITHKVTKLLSDTNGGQPGTIAQMQAAASEIERATAKSAPTTPARRGQHAGAGRRAPPAAASR